MGRAFNQNEKDQIKEKLRTAGEKCFREKELRKTSVEELTRSAGIASGSFYAFYDSKEELYFEILSDEEKRIGAAIQKNLESAEITRAGFKEFLLQTVSLITENPLMMKILNEEEYRSLLSKIPENKLREHLQEEYGFTAGIVGHLQDQNRMNKIKPEILSALLYTLFLLQLHRKEIGETIFPEIFEFLIDIISDALINEGERNFNSGVKRYLI